MWRLVLTGWLLVAPPALAQAETPPATDAFSQERSIEGVGRISVQGGWRLSSNNTFYDSFYALPGYECVEGCLRGTRGGPYVSGTFAYSISDYLEVGIDLFLNHQRVPLSNAAALSNFTYGALLGLRFQSLFEALTPGGVIPFIGLQTGPSLAYSLVEGVGRKEVITQPWVGTVGATLLFSEHWGLTAEYRLAFARGRSPYNDQKPLAGADANAYKGLASYNAGGNWFALGVTYLLAAQPSRGFQRF